MSDYPQIQLGKIAHVIMVAIALRKFKICGYFPATNVVEAEKLVHQELESLRFTKQKEFFKGFIDLILQTIENFCSLFSPKNWKVPIDAIVGFGDVAEAKPASPASAIGPVLRVPEIHGH